MVLVVEGRGQRGEGRRSAQKPVEKIVLFGRGHTGRSRALEGNLVHEGRVGKATVLLVGEGTCSDPHGKIKILAVVNTENTRPNGRPH